MFFCVVLYLHTIQAAHRKRVIEKRPDALTTAQLLQRQKEMVYGTATLASPIKSPESISIADSIAKTVQNGVLLWCCSVFVAYAAYQVSLPNVTDVTDHNL
jgi:hypothetical protein